MTAKTKTEMISAAFELRDETDKAFLVFDGIHKLWLPKSQIVSMRNISGADYEIRLPCWLAKKKRHHLSLIFQQTTQNTHGKGRI